MTHVCDAPLAQVLVAGRPRVLSPEKLQGAGARVRGELDQLHQCRQASWAYWKDRVLREHRF